MTKKDMIPAWTLGFYPIGVISGIFGTLLYQQFEAPTPKNQPAIVQQQPSTPNTYTQRSHARRVIPQQTPHSPPAKIEPSQREPSTLEHKIQPAGNAPDISFLVQNATSLFADEIERRNIIEGYDSNINYGIMIKEGIAKEISNIAPIRYGLSQSFGNIECSIGKTVFKVEQDIFRTPVERDISLIGYKKMDGTLETIELPNRFLEKRPGFSGDAFWNANKEFMDAVKKGDLANITKLMPRTKTDDERDYLELQIHYAHATNQRNYLVSHLLRKSLPEIEQSGRYWQSLPWREPQSFGFRTRNNYDQNTKELIFEGKSSCPPCERVVAYLVEHKIRFRERRSDSPETPSFKTRSREIFGTGNIIQKVNEIYGIR